MDSRRHFNVRLLTAGLFVSLFAAATVTRAQQGATYVHIAADTCSGTKLKLELDGMTPPQQARLKVTRDSDSRIVVDEPVTLNNGQYSWSGLLAPLGKYRAQLFDVNQTSTPLGLAYVFNNNEIVKDFIEGERGEIVQLTRGGDESINTTQTERKPLLVDKLPLADGKNKLHIVVIDLSNNNKADEYFGEPPANQVWNSRPLLLGNYRVIVIEYKGNKTCTLVRRR
jgi:hypothetical protein